MKKVTVVVMDKYRDASLEKLRELGILHLEKKTVSSDRLSALLDRKAKTENAASILLGYAPKKALPDVSAYVTPVSGDMVATVLGLAEKRKTAQEALFANAKEQSRLEKWGDFDPQAFAEFAAQGLALVPYELPRKTYETLGGRGVIVLGTDKTTVYCLAVGEAIPNETPWVLPEQSLSALARAAESHNAEIAKIEAELATLSFQQKLVSEELKRVSADIEFEIAKTSMEALDSELSTDSALDDAAPAALNIAWITGFAPDSDLGLIKRASAENGWAFYADEPSVDDAVPTKLRNNKLASLIYPLTGFLEVLPGYNEVDVSGWFLLFFSVFFGMIFGDAGYGLLLLIIAVIGIAKTAKNRVPEALKMMALLSLSTVVWGVLTCTWFGIDASLLPSFLKSVSLPLISGAEAAKGAVEKAIVDQNLMIFCFSLALLQLGIAHVIGIIRNIRSLRLFADIGSLGMLAGMYNLILSLVVSNSFRQIPFLPVSLYLLIGGFALSFVFANYAGSIGQSVLESVKNIIPTILGITNVFSDVMSYIRLWAVGLAGASISTVVNTMAGPLLGSFIIFLGIILLVFGHGLNLILNVLSVLVHGVRLNTLEFSGHLGLTWSGFAYKPFSKR
jgi:V/A-type H+-transporting ATPase subunit I